MNYLTWHEQRTPLFQQNTLTRLGPKISRLLSDASDPYKYRRNLVKIELYYEELNYEQIVENPTYRVCVKYITM